MIVDSKVSMFAPPPSYSAATAPPPTVATLPPHILLHIVYTTFPQTPSIDQGKIERQRRTLLWLVTSLRLVNRSFYLACMHVLRSTYLPAYQSLIRPPYTSDPFPSSSPPPSSPTLPSTSTAPEEQHQPIQTIQRETVILDKFIALKVREDVLVDESALHLEREDMFKDLFDHAQPKARLEDLVRLYGVLEGVVSVGGNANVVQPSQQQRRREGSASARSSPAQSTTNLISIPSSPLQSPTRSNRFFSSLFSSKSSPSPPPSPTTRTQVKIKPIQFSKISVSLSPRTISLVVGSGANRRTFLQIQREGGRDMTLDLGARRLVKELKNILVSEANERTG